MAGGYKKNAAKKNPLQGIKLTQRQLKEQGIEGDQEIPCFGEFAQALQCLQDTKMSMPLCAEAFTQLSSCVKLIPKEYGKSRKSTMNFHMARLLRRASGK